MKTFKEFITEKAAPEDVAARAAAIFGNRTYKGSGLKADKGTYVPLKNKGHPSSIGAAVTKFEKHPNAPVDKKKFPIKDLTATQPFVKVNDKDKLRSKIQGGTDGVHVITHKGKHYIADGHHQVMGARLRGEKEIEVNHTDLDRI